jgi:hypothetical protein
MRKTSILLLWVLNLFDAVMTWYAVAVGQYAREANPPMIWAIGKGWWVFFAIKISLMTAISAMFYRLWNAPAYNCGRVSVRAMAYFTVFTYSALAAWHCYGFVAWHLLK